VARSNLQEALIDLTQSIIISRPNEVKLERIPVFSFMTSDMFFDRFAKFRRLSLKEIARLNVPATFRVEPDASA